MNQNPDKHFYGEVHIYLTVIFLLCTSEHDFARKISMLSFWHWKFVCSHCLFYHDDMKDKKFSGWSLTYLSFCATSPSSCLQSDITEIVWFLTDDFYASILIELLALSSLTCWFHVVDDEQEISSSCSFDSSSCFPIESLFIEPNSLMQNVLLH